VARTFRFVDMLGGELHVIIDPKDELPIPQTSQVISLGEARMLVESVTLNQCNHQDVYDICVATIPSDKRA